MRGRRKADLGCNNDRTEEDTLESPFFQSNVEMWLCPVNIDKGRQDGVSGDLGPLDDVLDKGGELCVLGAAGAGARLGRGGGGTAHGIVHGLDYAVYEIFWAGVRADCGADGGEGHTNEGPGDLEADELEEGRGVGRGVDERVGVEGHWGGGWRAALDEDI